MLTIEELRGAKGSPRRAKNDQTEQARGALAAVLVPPLRSGCASGGILEEPIHKEQRRSLSIEPSGSRESEGLYCRAEEGREAPIDRRAGLASHWQPRAGDPPARGKVCKGVSLDRRT